MVKHMIIWKLREDLPDPAARKAEIKQALEGLQGQIEGLLSMKIEICGEGSGDLMMNSTFVSKEALAAYQAHPAHRQVAEGLVRPSVCQRLSFDFEE